MMAVGRCGGCLHLLTDVILSVNFFFNLLLVEFEDVEPTENRGPTVCNSHLFPNPVQSWNLMFVSGLAVILCRNPH